VIYVFILSFWIIDFPPLLYGHFLGLSRDVVLWPLRSSLDITTNSSVVGILFTIFVLHIVVAVIIICIA
jgi:hypothetical protein